MIKAGLTGNIGTGKSTVARIFESLGVKYVPSKTNFILFESGLDGVELYEYLLKKGVIVREMTLWGFKDFNRVTMGLPDENSKFIEAFKQAMKEIKKL